MYSINITIDADADLSRLDTPVRERVIKKLRWLADNFDTLKPEVLTGEW